MGESWIEPTTGRQWRSWVIARSKLVATRLTAMLKNLGHGDSKSQEVADGSYMVVRPVVPPVVAIYDWLSPERSHDWSCDWSYDVTTGSVTSCDRSRPIARPYDWSWDRSFPAYKKKALNQASASVFFQFPDRAVLTKCRPRKAREGPRGHSLMQ